MADSKITALTSISTSTDPANDPLVIVDVSDTSMAATGTTKKVTLNQLLGASGTATLASATITGDLTVDTSTLKVDSANNRVGIGTASPAYTLDVAGAANFQKNILHLVGTKPMFAQSNDQSLSYIYTGSTALSLRNQADTIEVFRADSSGIFTFGDGAGGTRMTLNSTGLGVGGSPTTGVKLHVGGGNAHIRNAAGGQTKLIFGPSANYVEMGGIIYDDTDGTLTFGVIQNYAAKFITNNTERLRIKSTGQVRFVPLASDPVGAEAGDVYYNSTSNKLKCYNGTTWNDLF